jgi:hypothetical protein
MENGNKKQIGLLLGVLLILFAFRSAIIINDLLTAVLLLILGLSVLYNYEKN